jgi:hypothetical protein
VRRHHHLQRFSSPKSPQSKSEPSGPSSGRDVARETSRELRAPLTCLVT